MQKEPTFLFGGVRNRLSQENAGGVAWKAKAVNQGCESEVGRLVEMNDFCDEATVKQLDH